MNTSQLIKCLESDDYIKPLFQGVYAVDRLPLFIEKRPSLYVVNSDLASNFGKHWLCIYFKNDHEFSCVFFDSLGKNPSCYNKFLTDFLDRNCKYVHYNAQRLQSDTSSVCGHYVLYFSYFKARNIPAECIWSRENFGLNPDVNDLCVYNFCKKMFSWWHVCVWTDLMER